MLWKTEPLLAPVQYEQDCPLIYRTTALEDQIEGMGDTIRCERAKNAAQREYRLEVLGE